MGRKKRKTVDSEPLQDEPLAEIAAQSVKRKKQEAIEPAPSPPPSIPADPRVSNSAATIIRVNEDVDDDFENFYEGTNSYTKVENETEEDRVESILELTGDKDKLSSGYAIHATSGEYEPIDIYVSDGSEDEEDFDVILTNSKMGVMRRGGILPVIQNKQWIRGNTLSSDVQAKVEDTVEEELDPAVKAARELAEKGRQLELAKEEARRKESEENAGRDPCLFSKRTAFDIRMDQIEDKPWERGDITDFFNYGMSEIDWNEYAEMQLTVRQELTDAVRQKRQPDPTIVPVAPRAPSKQTPKVAVRKKKESEENDNENQTIHGSVIGPQVPIKCELIDTKDGNETENMTSQNITKDEENEDDIAAESIGGAWGGNAVPGSMLAKLIEEQEATLQSSTTFQDETESTSHYSNQSHSVLPPSLPPPPPPPLPSRYESRVYGNQPPGTHHSRQQFQDSRSHTDHGHHSGQRHHSYDSRTQTEQSHYTGHSGQPYHDRPPLSTFERDRGRGGRGRGHGPGRGRGHSFGRGMPPSGRGGPPAHFDGSRKRPRHDYNHEGGGRWHNRR